MPLTSQELTDIIKDRLHATEVEVQDMSGGCVSDIFLGKNKLSRHRLVNSALKEEIGQIHAFTQKVFTVSEWEEQKRLFNA
ncbi:hypothetical protein C6P42_005195 [Pichia californica]|nr:hypothetical protein C6P42_005195 [[Candida] californica]